MRKSNFLNIAKVGNSETNHYGEIPINDNDKFVIEALKMAGDTGLSKPQLVEASGLTMNQVSHSLRKLKARKLTSDNGKQSTNRRVYYVGND